MAERPRRCIWKPLPSQQSSGIDGDPRQKTTGRELRIAESDNAQRQALIRDPPRIRRGIAHNDGGRMSSAMARRRRAVVAGGAGFLGSHLCERLLDEEYEVVCLDDLSTGQKSNLQHCEETGNFRLLQTDVTQGVRVEG